MNSLNDSPCISENSSQSLPHINHHCSYECGDPLEGIFYHQCTCKLCGNGAHYGYNCPPEVPIIPNPGPFNNQTIKELSPTVHSLDSKYDLVYKYPNVFNPPSQLPFIFCEFCENDARYGHYCTPQVPFVYPKPCYNQDFNFSPEFQKFHDFQQQDLCCENCGEEEKEIEEDQATNARYWKIHACYDDDDDDYAFTITPNEPVHSLSMGNEHLDTIPVTESDEFIKSSVENLVPIPSESEGESECDVPTREDFKTFSNILFDAEYESDSSDDQSFYDEDVDSLLDEFAGELALLKSIPPGLDETDCDFEEEIRLIEKLLYDNSSPHPPKELVSDNFDTEIESFSPSPIPVEDSDSLMEEINFSFTPDYPMPPGIEDNDYDSEREILISEDFLAMIPFHFQKLSYSILIFPRSLVLLQNHQMEKSPDLLSHLDLKTFQL
nr:hypothetical protein [Tanacetum cinerariifolium]